MLPETAPIVKRGHWLYDDAVTCEVRIVSHHVLYGTGDHEDPPEIREDREVECYYLLFHTPAGKPEWGGGGGFLSLEQAVLVAESQLGPTLKWEA
jgi:hypothetical protein